ncbi:MAG: ABC1 kinase family protein [Chitinophagales bacterium]
MIIFRHLTHFKRYRTVMNVLAHHGFGYITEQISLFRWRKKSKPDYHKYAAPERARMALEQLGPTYIKLGQLLSTRPDIIPRAFITEFEKLQDKTIPIPFADIQTVFENNGLSIEANFTYIENEPIATASIGQVHRARLINGEEVAVKVIKPGVREVIKIDLEILMELARLAEKRTRWGSLYQVVEIAQEFAEALINELDFTREGRNADQFRKDFHRNSDVLIPKVYWNLTTKNVLTMEYIEGIKVSDVDSLRKAGFNLQRVATIIVESFFSQVYEVGFFHADPHPGNLAVSPQEKVIFYDFGQMGTVDVLLKERGMDLIQSMVRYDVNGVTRAILSLGFAKGHINREEFRRDVSRLQRKYYGIPMADIQLGIALAELIQLTFKYQIRVPPELSLMVKMLMTCESLVCQLDADLSLLELFEPMGHKIIMKRYAPDNIRKKLSDAAIEYATMARNLPREVETILELMGEGELKLQLEIAGIKNFVKRADILTNRISVSIVAAGLIVGTALASGRLSHTLLSQVPLAELGFVAALVLGLFLIVSIVRSGRF